MEIKNTKTYNLDGSINVMIYGASGAGKTRLCSTISRKIVLSAEAGLLSLASLDCPYIEIDSINTLVEAFEFLYEHEDYDTIILNSLSEIAEIILEEKKASNKDTRQAFGECAIAVTKLVKSFRDCPKNVVMLCKEERVKLDEGVLYSMLMPGQKLCQSLPYLFDEVFRMVLSVDEEGNPDRYIQTISDNISYAKDRSGNLDQFMPPDLGLIFRTIKGDVIF